MTAPEEVLLDLNELATGRKFVGLGAFAVSDDQSLLAYTIDYVGFRQFSLHVKDLRTGRTLADTAERVTSVEWAADNKTLFLTTEDAVTKRSDRLWRHMLGAGAPQPVYREKDELYDISISKTRDKKYLLVEIGATDTTECRYLRANRPSESFAVFLPREKKHRYYVDHRAGLFYIRTNKNAVNFQVVTAPENHPAPANWKTFIAHRDDALIAGIDLFQDFAVAIAPDEAHGQATPQLAAGGLVAKPADGPPSSFRRRSTRLPPAARPITSPPPTATTTRASPRRPASTTTTPRAGHPPC